MGKLRFLIVIALGVMIAGCATKPTIGKVGSAPETLSLLPTDADGVLVIGLERPRQRGVHGMAFHPYDPVIGRLIEPTENRPILDLFVGGSLFNKVDVAGEIQYLLNRVPAGHYYLTRTYWGPHGNTLMYDGSIGFEVKPGTVTYAGNVRFRTKFFVFQDVEIYTYGRNDTYVKYLIEKDYPKITAGLRHQPMEITKLKCYLSKGEKGCYRK